MTKLEELKSARDAACAATRDAAYAAHDAACYAAYDACVAACDAELNKEDSND